MVEARFWLLCLPFILWHINLHKLNDKVSSPSGPIMSTYWLSFFITYFLQNIHIEKIWSFFSNDYSKAIPSQKRTRISSSVSNSFIFHQFGELSLSAKFLVCSKHPSGGWRVTILRLVGDHPKDVRWQFLAVFTWSSFCELSLSAKFQGYNKLS